MNNTEKKVIKKKIESMGNNSRYTDRELSFISNTFLDNKDLIMAIRKHFLQGEMLASEESILKVFAADQGSMDILRKCFLPEIEPDAPLNQAIDLWVSIDTKEKLMEDVYWDMKARMIVIDYVGQQLHRMVKENYSTGDIDLRDLIFNDKKGKEEAYYELKARNTILTHIDMHLEELRVLAISHSELSIEEKTERMSMDSNK